MDNEILINLFDMLPADKKSSINMAVSKYIRGFSRGRIPDDMIKKQLKTNRMFQQKYLESIFSSYYSPKNIRKTDPEQLKLDANYSVEKLPGILACYFWKTPEMIEKIWENMQSEIDNYTNTILVLNSESKGTQNQTSSTNEIDEITETEPDIESNDIDKDNEESNISTELETENFVPPAVDPYDYNGFEFIGYIHIYNTPNGGIYYNFSPIAEIDTYSGYFVERSNASLREDYPQFGNINIFTSNSRVYDLGRKLKNGKPYIIDIDSEYLRENYNANGTINQTKWKIDLKELIDDNLIHEVYDEPFGYYQIFDVPDLSEIINSGKTINLNSPQSTIIPSEKVMLRSSNTLIGPFQVKEEKPRGESSYSYYVNPEGKKNKYVYDAYDGSYDKKAFISIRYDTFKDESIEETHLVNIAKLPKRKIDFLSDEQLLSGINDLYEKRKDGDITLTESILLAPGIPDVIVKSRTKRMEAMIQQNDWQNEWLDGFMNLIAKSLLEKFENDDSQYNEILSDLATNPTFVSGISSSQAFIDAKQERQNEYEEFCKDIDERKNEKQQELENLEAELSKKQNERERLRQEAIDNENANLKAIQAEYQKYSLEVEEKKKVLDDLTKKLRLEQNIDVLRFERNQIQTEKNNLEDQIKDITAHFEKVTNETLSRMADIKINEHIAKALTSAVTGESKEESPHDALSKIVESQIVLRDQDEINDNDLIQKLTDFFKIYRINYSPNEILNLYICFTQGFLTVLSGAPGTGKTTACSILAHSLGMDRKQDGIKESRFISVPVERGWSSKRDLIGYYNPLTKEFDKNNQQVYRALEISDWECEKDIENLVPPMAILLDEANLSQMEYYWASFMNVGDYALGQSLIEIGNGQSFRISKSLRFLATINNDHTTESLSPRLIDRAWVISLPSDGQFKSIDFNEYESPVSMEQMQRIFGVSSGSDENMDMFCRSILNEMYRLCNNANMNVSHRTKGAIKNYCIAGSKIFIDDSKNANRTGSVIAADYAIAQKILPMIQGQGPSYKENVLEEFKRFFNHNSLTKSSGILDRIIRDGEENMNFYRFFG